MLIAAGIYISISPQCQATLQSSTPATSYFLQKSYQPRCVLLDSSRLTVVTKENRNSSVESRALQQPNGLNTNPGNAVSLNLPVRRTASRTSANAADPRCLKQYLTPKMVLDSGKGQPPAARKN
jgi:hypothetical protein